MPRKVTTPFGDLYGQELENAESLYLYFYDMVNDGAKNDYSNARFLYADPEKFLNRMKTQERANIKYHPDHEVMIEEKRLEINRLADEAAGEELVERER